MGSGMRFLGRETVRAEPGPTRTGNLGEKGCQTTLICARACARTPEDTRALVITAPGTQILPRSSAQSAIVMGCFSMWILESNNVS